MQKILHQYYEEGQLAVFSEIVHMYKPSFELEEMVILVTSSAIYLLDRRCNLKTRYELKDLSEIILVKANPSIFALSFSSGQAPLILQSFRRAELMIFVLSQREKTPVKPKIVIGDALKVKLRSGKTVLMEFDKAVQSEGQLSQAQRRILDNSQLNNFVNAHACGYLEICQKGLFGGNKWTRVFVVLSNVGLLYFKDVLDPPVDLFPILNCELQEVDPSEADEYTTVFRLEFTRKRVTLRCGTLSEYQVWIKAIRDLQQQTESKRKTLKAREMARITEMQKKV